jgi:uncharacterized membrane protein
MLPVEIAGRDDRIEEPEGIDPVVAKDHVVLKGIPPNWPYFLGYGPVGAFASDCSPHWGSPESLTWPHYSKFWSQLTG